MGDGGGQRVVPSHAASTQMGNDGRDAWQHMGPDDSTAVTSPGPQDFSAG